MNLNFSWSFIEKNLYQFHGKNCFRNFFPYYSKRHIDFNKTKSFHLNWNHIIKSFLVTINFELLSFSMIVISFRELKLSFHQRVSWIHLLYTWYYLFLAVHFSEIHLLSVSRRERVLVRGYWWKVRKQILLLLPIHLILITSLSVNSPCMVDKSDEKKKKKKNEMKMDRNIYILYSGKDSWRFSWMVMHEEKEIRHKGKVIQWDVK